jgi:tetratricopeptide (TPR) repeat protein
MEKQEVGGLSMASSFALPEAIQQRRPLQPPFPQISDPMTKPLEIFLVCSREKQDLELRIRLEQGLSPLCRAGAIALWHEDMMIPGVERQQEVATHLGRSDLILLLLSQHFFASEACYNIQQEVMEKRSQKEAFVIPIILRPCDWEETFNTMKVLPTSHIPITSWPDLDEAFLDVLKGIRSIINARTSAPFASSLFTNGMRATSQSEVLPSRWHIHYRRNPFFTGRESVLVHLREMLTTQKKAALTQALTGLGGIGKTQTAVEYAYRYHQEYSTVLWARADSREALTADFATIAETLDLSAKNEQDQQYIVQAVKQWLNTHTGWLLILDDVEDIEGVCDFLSQASEGHIILTTRTKSVGTVAHAIEIEKMQIAEGLLFLLRRAKMIRLDDPVDTASDVEQEQAREISAMMDGLPLALDQAGAYIEETGCDLAHYLELYQKRRTELLKKRGKHVSGHSESVATTFSLCFEKVAQVNAAATELLRCCALLHPDTIPEELFTEGAVELGPLLQPLSTNPFLFDEAIADLFHYSLIDRNAETHMLSIHRLVQAVLVDEMEEQLQHIWAERIVKAISTVFPGHQPPTWQHLQRYLPHAQVCATLIEQWNMQSVDVARWLFRVGYSFANSGFSTIAEQFYRQGNTLLKNDLSDVVKGLFGAQYAEYVVSSPAMETLISMSPLPLLYYQQGKYDQAESHLQRAIASIEQTCGPEHVSLIHYLNTLGAVYSTTGKYVEAEAHFQRALDIRLRTSPVDFDGLATSLNNLADLYRKQGKYDQAEPLYQQVLHISETQFGSDPIKIAHTSHNLALLYRAQGKYSQAEILYQRALSIYEHTYGPESPFLATVLNSLGALYVYQDEYIKAEPILLKALAMREKVLGFEHVDVGRTLNNLGSLYLHQKKYDQAHQALQRSLKIYKRSFGTEHPEVAMPLTNLGNLYSSQHKYAQAEVSLETALTIYEKTVGLHHPDAMTIFQPLVIVYAAQKKYWSIQLICQRLLPVLRERLGDHHEEVQRIQNMLFSLSQKRREQASTMRKSPSRSFRPKRNKKRRKK